MLKPNLSIILVSSLLCISAACSPADKGGSQASATQTGTITNSTIETITETANETNSITQSATQTNTLTNTQTDTQIEDSSVEDEIKRLEAVNFRVDEFLKITTIFENLLKTNKIQAQAQSDLTELEVLLITAKQHLALVESGLDKAKNAATEALINQADFLDNQTIVNLIALSKTKIEQGELTYNNAQQLLTDIEQIVDQVRNAQTGTTTDTATVTDTSTTTTPPFVETDPAKIAVNYLADINDATTQVVSMGEEISTARGEAFQEMDLVKLEEIYAQANQKRLDMYQHYTAAKIALFDIKQLQIRNNGAQEIRTTYQNAQQAFQQLEQSYSQTSQTLEQIKQRVAEIRSQTPVTNTDTDTDTDTDTATATATATTTATNTDTDTRTNVDWQINTDTFAPADDFVGQDVAVLYFKDIAVAASVAKSDVQDRIENSVNEMILYNSYGHEGFDQVDDLGWFEFESADFAGILAREKWYEQDLIVAAVENGSLDFTNYDYIVLVFDDTKNPGGASGSTFATPKELKIGNTSFGVKPYINMYMKPYTMLDHCFYKSQLYKNYELCYPNFDGEPLKRFDSTLVHEFIHSKQFDGHSVTKYCDDQVILGTCASGNYNMFDLLSSSRFYGTSMFAYNRHKAGWLRDEHIKTLSGTGSFEVTLDHLNSATGFNAAKIEVEGWDKDLWIEFRQPGKFDYGLYQPEFNNITSGLLLYEDRTLLNAGSGAFNELNVAVTDKVDLDVLGVSIEVLQVDKTYGQITFSVDLSGLVPTKTIPLEEKARCKRAQERCKIKQGEEFTNFYMFVINDIGFGDNSEKPWTFEFIGLPQGLTYSNSPVSRQLASYPGVYTRSPNTEVTFKAGQMEAKTYEFKMRIYNPADNNLYLDIPQFITIY
ncbi:MAG: hypothetical protein HRU38_21045 [Saccharospirillaceae bacterium]|nr:hypothetical protein [Pseudomonadales bacterium]NRB81119.1 hypothetical protein [Saccharospirillaceae bacterium]